CAGGNIYDGYYFDYW
nr:immunoglobulin heavy chain junction region [Mus musculus]